MLQRFSATCSSIRPAPEGISDVLGLTGNLVIIARDTVIENFVAGSSNDEVTGNDVVNRLEGRAGNDRLTGSAGADVMDGGAGRDLLWYEGDYDRSIEFHMRALELSPEYAWSLHHLGLAYAAKGMYEEALAAHEEALALVPYYEWGLGHAYALTGRTDEARAMVGELEVAASPDAWALAHIYAALGVCAAGGAAA